MKGSMRKRLYALGALVVVLAIAGVVATMTLAAGGDGSDTKGAGDTGSGNGGGGSSSSTPVIARDVLPEIHRIGTARVIVQVAANTAGADPDQEMRIIGGAQDGILSGLGGKFNLLGRFEHFPMMVLSVDESAMKSLAAKPGVVSVMLDRLDSITLRDTIPAIGAPAVYKQGFTGKGYSVAILDTGVDAKHPFFGGRVVAEACFSSTDLLRGLKSVCPNGQDSQVGPGSAAPCDLSECVHGTHVAGIAAGNAADINGVAKDAGIVAVQVFSKNLFSPKTSTADQIRGMEWVYQHAAEYHIAAVNMSLGGGSYKDQKSCDAENGPWKAAADKLKSVGVAVVVAAGNDGSSDSLSAPGCVSSVIAVGSVTKQDGISKFSNSNAMLDILGHGDQITSSVPGGKYAVMSGTSMASPHVAGAFVLLRSVKPAASVDEILKALVDTGLPIKDARNGLVRPRIQVDRAAAQLLGNSVAPLQPKTQPKTSTAPKTGVDSGPVEIKLPKLSIHPVQ